MGIKTEFSYKEFIQREKATLRAPYNPELDFYSNIKLGNVAKVRELCREELMNKQGLGVLSSNPLQNLKYHFTVTTALAARYCIDGGMDMSTAYTLSDFYIQKADACHTLKEVSDLHPIMCLDYARRMKNLRKEKICSRQVVEAIDYIYDNLHTRITLSELAEHVGCNPSYLSRIFKNETGITITDYIQDKKIETAQNMLSYSNYTPAQISTILAFPSQSYFTEVFKKNVGTTPTKFRQAHLMETDLNRRRTFY